MWNAQRDGIDLRPDGRGIGAGSVEICPGWYERGQCECVGAYLFRATTERPLLPSPSLPPPLSPPASIPITHHGLIRGRNKLQLVRIYVQSALVVHKPPVQVARDGHNRLRSRALHSSVGLAGRAEGRRCRCRPPRGGCCSCCRCCTHRSNNRCKCGLGRRPAAGTLAL